MHSPDGLKFGSVVDFADVGGHAGSGTCTGGHSDRGWESKQDGYILELDRHIPWNSCKRQKLKTKSCKKEEQMKNQNIDAAGTEWNVQKEYEKQQTRGNQRINEHLQVAHKAIEEAMQDTAQQNHTG